MQYFSCPRCKFVMVAKKHLCPTCGFKIKQSTAIDKQAKILQESEVSQSFWSKLIRWNFENSTSQKTDSTQEKPAISH